MAWNGPGHPRAPQGFLGHKVIFLIGARLLGTCDLVLVEELGEGDRLNLSLNFLNVLIPLCILLI
jgi:hypothetical protein